MRIVDISLLIVSALLGFYLAAFVAWNRRGSGARALSLLILGASIWSLSYAFEILASSISYKLFWERFEFFGIVIIPLAWFSFVAQYLGNPGWMKRILEHRFLLLIIPVATVVLVWTNEFHNLVWQQVELEPVGPLIVLDFERGPWFWVLLTFSYVLLLLASVKLVVSLFSVVRLQRWQMVLTLLAILLPWIGNIFYLTGWSPEQLLDWTAFLFLLSGMLFSVSLFRFQLANILPIAQEAVFAGLADSVVVLDLNDCIVDMNPEARKLMPYSGVKMLGKNLSEVTPDLIEHIRLAGLEKEYNAEFTLGEGQDLQYYDLHLSLLSDTNKNPIGHVLVLHQITQLKRDQAELARARDQLELVVAKRTEELKQAIEQLREELVQRSLAEKRFEDVIESAPDAMFVLDTRGRILLINGMAERLFGYPREELMGKSIAASLVPEQYREAQQEYFAEFMSNSIINQSSFGMDLYGKRKDGSVFPMEVDLSRLDTTTGFWVAINLRDISERKRVETAVRESEQTYRVLFENAGDAIFLSDLEGNILKVNQKAIELLGYSNAELQAVSMFAITVPDEHSKVKNNMAILTRGERLEPYLRHYLKKSGEVVPTENNTVLVHDAAAQPKFFQIISRDITERLKAEEARNKFLEEISQSNSQMRDLALRLQEVQELERQGLATVLHDRVGQSLTGLNLNLKILQNELMPQSGLSIQKRLDDSLSMVEDTTHMIRDVMADLNPPVLDEYGLSAAVKWYSGDFTNRTGIATHVSGDKIDPRLPARMEKILYRLLQESLNNVAKHAQASKVIISIKSDQECISLSVKDDGKGFDPGDNKIPTDEPHWGLLSMQQRAVSIGGELVIDSMPGMGTEVCVKVNRNHYDD